jgi:meiotically up-regulated gene 157 (Mug157) protein
MTTNYQTIFPKISPFGIDGNTNIDGNTDEEKWSVFIFTGSIQARWLRKIHALMQNNIPLHL